MDRRREPSCGATTTRTTRVPGRAPGEVIARTMGELSDAERRQVLGGTAAKLYGFELPDEGRA